MVGLSEGNHVGQKKSTRRSNQVVLQINFCLFFSFFLGRSKMRIFQLPCLFTVVYNSLEILSSFQSFAILIQLCGN